MSGYSDIRWNVFCQSHHRYTDIICHRLSIYMGLSLSLHILQFSLSEHHYRQRITASGTSGGRFAIRILRIPRPAVSTSTTEISPLVCRYSTCPPVKWSTCSRCCPAVLYTHVFFGRRFVPLRPNYLLASVVNKSTRVWHMPICADFWGQRPILLCSVVHPCCWVNWLNTQNTNTIRFNYTTSTLSLPYFHSVTALYNLPVRCLQC